MCKSNVRNFNIGSRLLVYDVICNSVINYRMYEIEYFGSFLLCIRDCFR